MVRTESNVRATLRRLACETRRPIVQWLFVGMAIVNVIPVWAWKYFPSQDGPAHLYNSYVLAHYRDSPLFQQYFRLHWSAAGNAFTHALFPVLLLAFPPLLAQRIFLTLYCAGLPFAFRYAVRAWRHSGDAMSFAGFLLVYNVFLHYGFWNFCFSIVFFLVAFGYLARHGDRLQWRSFGLMTLLALATYTAHILSWAMLVLAAVMLFAGAILKREFHRLPWLGLATLVPGVFALLYYGGSTTSASAAVPLSWRDRLWPIYGVPFLRGFTFAETDLARVIVAFVLVLLAGAVWQFHQRRRSLPQRQRKLPWNSAFGLGAVCLLLTLALPANGNFLQSRVALYAFIFLLMGVAATSDFGRFAPVVRTAVIGLSIAGILLRIAPYRHWNEALAEYVEAGRQVTANSTLLPVRYVADQDGSLRPTLHAAGLFIPKDFVNLYDYEAAFDYFPVQFQPNRFPKETLGWTNELDRYPPVFHQRLYEQTTGGRVDYILVEVPGDAADRWPERQYSASALAGYRLVFTSSPRGLAHLYRRSDSPMGAPTIDALGMR